MVSEHNSSVFATGVHIEFCMCNLLNIIYKKKTRVGNHSYSIFYSQFIFAYQPQKNRCLYPQVQNFVQISFISDKKNVRR